ncbi:MAG TPA: hypothetical protein ENH15_01375 [Actinobacteria bacterium]|nr:hypothetical protein [Actinomycetota bacterium]
MLRFPPDSVDRQHVEVVIQGCIGATGAVVGASDTSVDFQLKDSIGPVLAELAGLLRGLDMPADTFFDIPASGQRFGLFDF